MYHLGANIFLRSDIRAAVPPVIDLKMMMSLKPANTISCYSASAITQRDAHIHTLISHQDLKILVILEINHPDKTLIRVNFC